MWSFPEDLVGEVLARSPVQSLIKWRCVSKSWKALIDSPEFSKQHLSLGGSSTSSMGHKLIFTTREGDPDRDPDRHQDEEGRFFYFSPLYVTDFACDSPHNDKAATRGLEVPDPFKQLHQKVKGFHGCCNGLLCVTSDGDSTVALWNPYVKDGFWILPSSPLPKNKRFERTSIMVVERAYHGFGYDNAADDYKVVRLVPFNKHTRVNIYSLKSNSWRTVASRFPYVPKTRPSDQARHEQNRCSNAGVLANHAVHWVMGDHGQNLIVGIDLRTEKLNFVPKPPVCWGYELGVLDGCLCAISGYNLEGLLFDMWRMKEYGREESWTKEIIQLPFSVTYFLCDYVWVRPIAYSRRERNKVFFQGSDNMMWYDTEKQKLVRAAHMPESQSPMYDGYHFIASLIRPFGAQNTGTKHITKDSSGNKRKEIE